MSSALYDSQCTAQRVPFLQMPVMIRAEGVIDQERNPDSTETEKNAQEKTVALLLSNVICTIVSVSCHEITPFVWQVFFEQFYFITK